MATRLPIIFRMNMAIFEAIPSYSMAIDQLHGPSCRGDIILDLDAGCGVEPRVPSVTVDPKLQREADMTKYDEICDSWRFLDIFVVDISVKVPVSWCRSPLPHVQEVTTTYLQRQCTCRSPGHWTCPHSRHSRRRDESEVQWWKGNGWNRILDSASKVSMCLIPYSFFELLRKAVCPYDKFSWHVSLNMTVQSWAAKLTSQTLSCWIREAPRRSHMSVFQRPTQAS